jgi:hypothetical protein
MSIVAIFLIISKDQYLLSQNVYAGTGGEVKNPSGPWATLSTKPGNELESSGSATLGKMSVAQKPLH